MCGFTLILSPYCSRTRLLPRMKLNVCVGVLKKKKHVVESTLADVSFSELEGDMLTLIAARTFDKRSGSSLNRGYAHA